MKTFVKVIETIIVVVVLGLVGFAGLNLVQGTWEIAPVLSGSMRPGLSVGGVVIAERVPVPKLALRDVVLFQDPDKSTEQVVHRIVRVTKGPTGPEFKTQGDANDTPDPWTMTFRSHDAYEVRWSVPLVGYVAVAFDNNKGLVLAGAGLVLLLMAGGAILVKSKQGPEVIVEPIEVAPRHMAGS